MSDRTFGVGKGGLRQRATSGGSMVGDGGRFSGPGHARITLLRNASTFSWERFGHASALQV
jgi:hypothetical protein